jgi:hypothetical protein
MWSKRVRQGLAWAGVGMLLTLFAILSFLGGREVMFGVPARDDTCMTMCSRVVGWRWLAGGPLCGIVMILLGVGGLTGTLGAVLRPPETEEF